MIYLQRQNLSFSTFLGCDRKRLVSNQLRPEIHECKEGYSQTCSHIVGCVEPDHPSPTTTRGITARMSSANGSS